MTKPLPTYLTIREAAAALGISIQRVGQLVAEKKLGPTKMFQVGYRKVKHLERSRITARLQLAVSRPPVETPKP